jgi:hypothetical protein
MHRIVTAVGLLVLMSLPVLAQKEFEPTAAERQTIDDCIDNAAGDSELKQMSQCIGLIADPCVDEPGANTFTIVACNMREQKIWEESPSLGQPAPPILVPFSEWIESTNSNKARAGGTDSRLAKCGNEDLHALV